MAGLFRIARNPDELSTLPYVLWVPVGPAPLVLKAKDVWPRTAKVYCHRGEWPDDADIVEETPVRSCVRRGVAIDLVLDRYRENRSQFVLTTLKGGREGIFWQTAKTTRKTRPGMRLPTKRSAAGVLPIVVDTRERYAWKFERQQASLTKRALTVGDYAVESDGEVVGVVERKKLTELAGNVVDGSLLVMLGELSVARRAAIVVEDRWADVFRLQHVSPAMVAEMLAAAQVRYPNVPIVFCENRPLAQEWAYRFLGAAAAYADEEAVDL
ncbi:MAG: ERCC4 domain-containing protein [Acidimicrobiia bacterium]|nr:ERCC4 domain-containing protein [Acidimicrobiia bacterium]